VPSSADWNSTVRDLTDEEWAHIGPLVPEYSRPGRLGRPVKWPKRDIVDAILYVAGTGCQWRALPACYPPWKTVWSYHATWSRDGTWERICDQLRAGVRTREGRDPEPSAGIVDARSVQGASTVCGETRGYDAGKKVSGRKVFAVVDTIGLLLAVVVVAANTSDNAGGIACVTKAAPKTCRLTKIWSDSSFRVEFAKFCASLGIKAEVAKRIVDSGFAVIPRRWVVERSFAWLVNNRRLRTDYERDPEVTAGMIWAAHTRVLLRRLTTD
jgi:transposase